MPENPKPKTLLLTGANGRLGRVIASKFSDLGYEVLGIDQNTKGASVSPCYPADLTDDAAAREIFDTIWRDHGHIDLFIHTVGMWDGAPTVDVDIDRWRKVMDVNLTTTFLAFREMLRQTASSTESSLVTRLIAFASGQGADRGVPEQAAYSAAKAGVIRLVESVAAEYDKELVTAHAIAPSMILFDGMETQPGISVHELANLCVVLAGDAGSEMSGSTIRAYGSA